MLAGYKLSIYIFTILYFIFVLAIIIKIKSTSDSPITGAHQVKVTTKIWNSVDFDVFKFRSYVTRFNKTYSAQEYDTRFYNYKVSLSEIARLNAIHGDIVFGETEFSDMSEQEFSEKMLMKRSICVPYSNNFCSATTMNVSTKPSLPIPDQIDWRNKGVIGPIVNQKECQACWAISLAGVMEARAKINRLTKETLSVQQVLDCYTDGVQFGCKGGNIGTSLIIICGENKGVVKANDYPLTFKDETCLMPNVKNGVKVRSCEYTCVDQQNGQSYNESEEKIQRALMEGPVTAVVNAAIWRFYLGGIITRACVRGDKSYDHVIQIVGFDRKAEIPYYIIKNSWGELFGDQGYLKLAMYKNLCGIAEEVGYIDVEYIV